MAAKQKPDQQKQPSAGKRLVFSAIGGVAGLSHNLVVDAKSPELFKFRRIFGLSAGSRQNDFARSKGCC